MSRGSSRRWIRGAALGVLLLVGSSAGLAMPYALGTDESPGIPGVGPVGVTAASESVPYPGVPVVSEATEVPAVVPAAPYPAASRFEPAPLPPEPAEVRAIRDAVEAREAAVRKEIEDRVRSERQSALDRARRLQDRFTRAGRLDEALAARRLVRELEARLFSAQNDPGSLGGYRGRNGETFVFRVTGSTQGSVWGTDVYTDDSSLATAAVHAGVLDAGQSGLVAVTIESGRPAYSGSTRNGVTSRDWGAYSGSYRVARSDAATPDLARGRAADDPGDLTSYQARVGETLRFRVTGSTTGHVWGSDVYTSDSRLATAAVHAGILRPGETGVVRVTVLEGRGSYESSTRNGVTTSDYGPWGSSYRVERDDAAASTSAGPVADDPGNLTAYQGRVGEAILIRVTGATDGSVWGSDVYTSDSRLAAAAVHAGVLQAGETGVVRVTILEGRPSYDGSSRNGVTTSGYGSWGGSYRVERAAPSPEAVDGSELRSRLVR